MTRMYSLAGAMLAAAFIGADFGFEQPRRANNAPIPTRRNDGPVIDTTKESKRARRRRLAQEKTNDK